MPHDVPSAVTLDSNWFLNACKDSTRSPYKPALRRRNKIRVYEVPILPLQTRLNLIPVNVLVIDVDHDHLRNEIDMLDPVLSLQGLNHDCTISAAKLCTEDNHF